jgi:DNA polymerase-1
VNRSTPAAYRLLAEGAIALARVEENGVRVDRDYLLSAIQKTEARVADITKELQGKKLYARWRREFGEKTNLGSREQLAHMVFTVMGYEAKAYTTGGDTGFGKVRAKADKTAFEEIDNKFVKALLKIEQLKKAKSTYLEGIKTELVEHSRGNFYVHPSYMLNTVRSYRSSCNSPNFQNIPVRDPDLGDLIRRCYIPSEGFQLVELDFAQLEVRIIACHSKDRKLVEYIVDDKDMHGDMACALFMLKPEQVNKKVVRHAAKNMFVFPEFYGSVAPQCAADLWKGMRLSNAKVEGTETTVIDWLVSKGITERGKCEVGEEPEAGTFEAHVKKIEEKFWSNKMFAETLEWKRQAYRQYLNEGGFWLKTGFRVNGFHKRNDVTNYPIQGASFHLLLWSLIELQKWLDRKKMRSKIVGQIHDCLVLDVWPAERDEVIYKARQIMTEKVVKHWDWATVVPLQIEAEVCEVGAPWGTKKEWIDDGSKWIPKPKKV